MASKRKILPSFLLLVLSTLGFLVSLLAATGTLRGYFRPDLYSAGRAEQILPTTGGMLFLLIACLHAPTIFFTSRNLFRKDNSFVFSSLFMPANIALGLWVLVMAAGTYLSLTDGPTPALAIMTILGIAIPILWLVEFNRRKLPRSTPLREWGTLSTSLTVAPFIIMLVETLVVILVVIAVVLTAGMQPGFMESIRPLLEDAPWTSGSIEEMEQMLYEVAQNPVIAVAIFFVIGVIAPAVEEIFKPMAIWFLLRHPIKPHEGFSLGMISGGAFALLESASLVSQISSDNWLPAVSLRAATGMLHIGLSGLVGYGFAKSWHEKRYARSILFVLAAAGLHGSWNSLALVNGFSTSVFSPAAEGLAPSIAEGVSIGLMAAVFAGTVFITQRINLHLRADPAETEREKLEK